MWGSTTYEQHDFAVASAGDQVSMQYTGWLSDGRKFDSSRDSGQPFQFKIGQGQVIGGWDEGILVLTAGEHTLRLLPPLIMGRDDLMRGVSILEEIIGQ